MNVEFLSKLEAVKERLPTGAVPLYLKAFPESKESRVKNTLAGKIADEEILTNLELLAETLENL